MLKKDQVYFYKKSMREFTVIKASNDRIKGMCTIIFKNENSNTIVSTDYLKRNIDCGFIQLKSKE